MKDYQTPRSGCEFVTMPDGKTSSVLGRSFSNTSSVVGNFLDRSPNSKASNTLSACCAWRGRRRVITESAVMQFPWEKGHFNISMAWACWVASAVKYHRTYPMANAITELMPWQETFAHFIESWASYSLRSWRTQRSAERITCQHILWECLLDAEPFDAGRACRWEGLHHLKPQGQDWPLSNRADKQDPGKCMGAL